VNRAPSAVGRICARIHTCVFHEQLHNDGSEKALPSINDEPSGSARRGHARRRRGRGKTSSRFGALGQTAVVAIISFRSNLTYDSPSTNLTPKDSKVFLRSAGLPRQARLPFRLRPDRQLSNRSFGSDGFAAGSAGDHRRRGNCSQHTRESENAISKAKNCNASEDHDRRKDQSGRLTMGGLETRATSWPPRCIVR
jgi:hypothetical protein